jgi:hypothetical protein
VGLRVIVPAVECADECLGIVGEVVVGHVVRRALVPWLDVRLSAPHCPGSLDGSVNCQGEKMEKAYGSRIS